MVSNGPLPQISTRWCSYCQIPTTEMVCVSCGRRTDELLKGPKLRPVFRQEIELMSRLVGRNLMRSPRDLVLWRSGHDYYVLGP